MTAAVDTAGWRDLAAIAATLDACGAGPLHREQVLRSWTQAGPLRPKLRANAPEHPRPLADALPAIASGLDAIARVVSTHPQDADGSARLLLALHDGQQVETVLLPGRAGRDGGVCVSTQVGCAVGCVFCMTGQGGLARQLGSAEIVAQVVAARRIRAVRRVLMMGMGEPSHNLEAVLDAIAHLGTLGGIGHKDLVFSTVGDGRALDALARARVRPSLALSLHSTFAARRAELLPRAPRIDPAELVGRAAAYAEAERHPAQLQWTLLAGVNDGDDELEGLLRLLRGRRGLMLNLILYNRVDALPWQRTPIERAEQLARTLNQAGILTRLRHSAGQEVEGGCGQLRARAAGAAQPLRLQRRPHPHLERTEP